MRSPIYGPHTWSLFLREASGAGHPKSAQGAATLGGVPPANTIYLRKSSGAGAHGVALSTRVQKVRRQNTVNKSTGREAATETSLPPNPGKPRPLMQVSLCTLTMSSEDTGGRASGPVVKMSSDWRQEAFSRQNQRQMGVSCPQRRREGGVPLAGVKLGW